MTTRVDVRSGLDGLLEDAAKIDHLRSKKVALLVNPTSVDRHLNHSIDLLSSLGVEIVKLFGPEHGVRSEAQDMESVACGIDAVTGIPTKSLYGTTFDSLAPTDDDLDDIELLIADIQDIGSRYYTYAYTIGLTMQACGRNGVDVWVVDRPNPIRGDVVEGGIIRPQFASFVGMQPLPTRPGMTMGELCLFFNRYTEWQCDLEILKMTGWRRDLWFDETTLPWVMPSPNMPTLDTAICYPGQCLLEGTHLSEGRGTTRPFELFGAPYVDAHQLKERLESYHLLGVRFRPVSFRPMFQKYANTNCTGLQIHVYDRNKYSSLETSYAILQSFLQLYPNDFQWRADAYEFVDQIPAIDLLLGNLAIKDAIIADAPLEVITAIWDDPFFEQFLEQRRNVLLY